MELDGQCLMGELDGFIHSIQTHLPGIVGRDAGIEGVEVNDRHVARVGGT